VKSVQGLVGMGYISYMYSCSLDRVMKTSKMLEHFGYVGSRLDLISTSSFIVKDNQKTY
jgi:hypothetical protein